VRSGERDREKTEGLSLELESREKEKRSERMKSGGEFILLEWSYGEAKSGDGERKIAHRLAGETYGGLEG
jgi:hypothetical protein